MTTARDIMTPGAECVGMLSQADVARSLSATETGETVADISE